MTIKSYTHSTRWIAQIFLALVVSLSGIQAVAAALEEIVVTAQRRAQNTQDVPISLTAYDAQQVTQARLTNLEEVAAIAPNVVIGNESESNNHIFIRGIGTFLAGAGSTQSVGYSIDEVFVTRAGAFNLDLFDIERIEVLRGPQGTLYGRNVVSGAVNAITKKPELGESKATLQLGAGNYSLAELNGMVNIPVSESTSIRATLQHRSRDGYVDNVFIPVDPALFNPDPFLGFEQCGDCNGDMDDVDSTAIRLQIGGDMSDNLSWNLSVFRSDSESDGVHIKNTPVLSGFFSQIGFVPQGGSHDVINGNNPGELEQDTTMVTLRADYETGIGVLTSLSSWQRLNYEQVRDIVNVPHVYNFPAGPFAADPGGAGFRSEPNIDEEATVFSQEFRLSSVNGGPFTFDDKLSWIIGLYYSSEEIERSQFRPRRLTVSTTVAPATSAPQWDQDVDRTSAAVFGQATLALTDNVNLTTGLRYTYDAIDFSTQLSDPLGAEPWITSLNPGIELYGPTDSDESWTEPTGQIALDWHVTEDAMLYVLYSRGFKSGGYQGSAPSEAAAIKPFEPEFADNYEVGLKSELFNNTVRLNLSYFDMDFDDLQLNERQELVPGDPTTAVVTVFNAGSAEITGIEFELSWLTPIEGLMLTLNGGTLDTEIHESSNPLNVGRDLPQAPEFSGTAVLSYITQLSESTELDFRLAVRHTGEFWWDPANKEPGLEDSYNLLDASIGISNGPWHLNIWGKNLNDEEYRSYAQSILQDTDAATGAVTNRGGSAVSRVGAPRSYGITISRDFSW